MTTKMDTNKCVSQPDEADRLLQGLVELRARQVDLSADSVCRYDEPHADERLNQRDSIYRWLSSLLEPKAEQGFLDVSCGRGTLLRFAEETDLDVVGLDLSEAAVVSAAEQVPSAFTSVADAEQLPYADNTFAYITNLQLRRLLDLNGLRVIRTLEYERARPRTWRDLLWYVRHPHRLGRVIVAPFIPLNLASFPVYLCMKEYS
jgi:SAM-dependent methyltransferase